MPSSNRTASYVSIVASAVLSFACLIAVGCIFEVVRGCIVAYRSDLALPSSTAFLFAHSRTIWASAYAVGFLIFVTGVASVRRAPDSDCAMRRAMLFSTFSSAFASLSLFAALLCILRPFIVGVITQSSLPQ
jgi:hypothetical protein